MGLNFDSSYLKDLIGSSEFKSNKRICEELNIKEPTFSTWLTSSKAPEEELYKIIDLLELSEEQEEDVLQRPLKLEFRARPQPSLEEKVEVKKLVRIFIKKLEDSKRPETQKFFNPDQNEDLESCAQIIRRWVSPKTAKNLRSTDIFSAIKSLRLVGVNVFVLPFHKFAITNLQSSKKICFSSKVNKQLYVFLNSNRTAAEMLFDLIHELAHYVYLLSDKEDIHNSQATEDACDKIAEYAIYGNPVLQENIKDEFFQLIRDAKPHLDHNFAEYKAIYTELIDTSWDFKGLERAIANQKIYREPKLKEVVSFLDKLDEKQKKKTIDEYYFTNFSNEDFDNALGFFIEDASIQKSEIYRGFALIKDLIVSKRVDHRLYSHITGMNIGDSEELLKLIRSSYESGC